MRKNVIKFTAIALLSAFALTACDDDIVAKPTGYDDNSPIIADVDVYNNNLQDIYDSIRSGNLASDVLDELLYQYSVSVFGNYNKVTAAKISAKKDSKISEGTTLKEAVASAYGDRTVANAFINKHEAFWTKNSDGKRVDDNDKVVEGDVVASEQEIARLKEKWETIEKRIAQTLYSSISGGAYSERGIFEEKKFLSSLASSIEHKVADPRADATPLFKGVISPSVEDYEVFSKKAKSLSGTDGQDYILHRENYQLHADCKDLTENANQAITYVEDEIIPSIYRQLLVEQYILDETFNTLGRTSARHISVLSIKKNDNYAQNAKELMNKFLDNVVFNKTRAYDADPNNVDHNLVTLNTFKTVSNAWVGTFMSDKTGYNSTKEYELMSAALGEPQSWKDDEDQEYKYYQGTAYGDMVEELKKISMNPALSENESTYTGGNSYPISVGSDIKTRELETNDYTFTGWYVKSVGVSGLPDSIKNQLFDINVANALTGKEDETCVRYYKDATTGEFVCNLDEAKYKNNPGSLINVVGRLEIDDNRDHDQYFLRNTNRIKGDPFKNDLLFESDGTYYMVLVEDAIRSTNLDKQYYGVGEDKNGNQKQPYEVLENYVNEIVEIVADNDTYKTLSKKHWVEKMGLKYHDQVVYDYFKSNFPELFDDDDDSSND